MKGKNFALKILKENQLRKTASRLLVLEAFIVNEEGNALTHQEIESYCKGLSDRVTIYRTLNTFTEKNVLTRIPGVDGSAKYLFNYGDDGTLKPIQKNHQHLHFSCTKCGKTVCVDEYTIALCIMC